MTIQVNIAALDKIITDTIAAIENGKKQIYDIWEAARQELVKVRADVERVKQEAAAMVGRVDELEGRERRSRIRLMEVSRNFRVYGEADIKSAYEEAKNLQVELSLARQREIDLRRRRDELERRLASLQQTARKAESLVSQVGVVLGYLSEQMGDTLVKVESLQQRQVFGVKIIKAQEEERKRVAREIHDGPAQTMANVVFRAEVCERMLDIDHERARQELQQLKDQVRGCLKEVRKIIFDLRPMALDDLGLVPALRRLVDDVQDKAGLQANLTVLGDVRRLDSYLEVAVFRIVQEALANVAKHAQARTAQVVVEFHRGTMTVAVYDDGRGFDVEAVRRDDHFGLLSMQERAALIDGKFELKSQTGRGTRLTVRLPMK